MNAEFGETTPAQETIPDLESKDAQLYAVLQTLSKKRNSCSSEAQARVKA